MAEDIQIKINAAVESAQAATTIGQLRNSLVELQDIAENSDLGAEQFRNLQSQIVSTSADLAAARDRIGDIQDKISTLQGTPIERVKNSFGLLKQAIFDLDFDKARIGVEGLANAFTPLGPDGLPLKGLAAMKGALGNVTGAASQLGTTFINLGRTLLANPIFLLATVITTITVGIVLLLNKLGLLQPIFDVIAAAVEYVTDSFNALTEAIGLNTAATDKNLKKTLAAEEEKRKAIEQTLKTQENIAESVKDLNSVEQLQVEKLTGIYVRQSEDLLNVRLSALNKLKSSYESEIKALDDVAKNKRKLTNDEKKLYDEIVIKIEETNGKIVKLSADRVRETTQAFDEIRMRSILAEKDEAKRARLLRDEEFKIAESDYDRRATLLQERNVLQTQRNAAYTAEVIKNLDNQIKGVNDQIKIITDKAALDKFDAEQKYIKSVTQLNQDYAREQKEATEENVKFNLDQLKKQGNIELLQNEGFEIKQLQIRNKYIKLVEEFQLKNAAVFFKTETDKQNFLLENTKAIADNQEKINKITKDRNDLLTEEGIKTKEIELRLAATKDKTLSQSEIELANARIDLTITRDKYDLLISQTNEQAVKDRLVLEGQLKIAEIKEKIRAIDEEAIMKVAADKAADIQAELNALDILLSKKIKVDQETLSSRQKTIDFVKSLETKSEEELAALRNLTVEDQIQLIKKVEVVKNEQIKNDELTLQLQKSNIQDFSDFESELLDLSSSEQREFNARRLENERETTDSIILLKEDEVRKKQEIEERQKQFIINTATTTISALQTISDIFYAGRLRAVKGNAVEEEKVARKQFNVNKALNLSTATMTGIISVMEAYKNGMKNPIPLLGPLTGTVYAGLAAAVSAINIAKIAATTFTSKGAAPSVGTTPTENINGATPNVTGIPSEFTAPTFFGLGEERMTTTVGPNQQRVYVVETDITSTQNRVSVIENRSVIQ